MVNKLSLQSYSSVPKYIPVINSLRGLASVIVCLHHLICMPIAFIDHSSYIFKIAHEGSVGVQIFFVITGVVIPIALLNGNYNYSLFGKFILKRIIRIEPPYLLSIIVIVLLLLFKQYFFPKSADPIPSIENILTHIGYIVPFVKNQGWLNPVFWTLAVEFQFYIIISLAFPFLVLGKISGRIMAYCLLFIAALAFPSMWFSPSWLPVFIMGIIYVNCRSGNIGAKEFWSIFLISVGFTFYLHNLEITLASIFTLAVIHFFSMYQSKVGNFFGDISYSLYLIHMTFPIMIVNFLVPHVTNIYTQLLVVLAAFIISVISAYIFYLIIEKPSKKYASKISLKTAKVYPSTDTTKKIVE